MANNVVLDSHEVGTTELLGSVKVEDEATTKEELVSDEESSLNSGSANEFGTCSASTSPSKGVWPEVMLLDDRDDGNDGNPEITEDPLTVNYLCQVTMEGEPDVNVATHSGDGPVGKNRPEEMLLTGSLSDDNRDYTSRSAATVKERRKKPAGRDLHSHVSCDYKVEKRQKSNRLLKVPAKKKRDYIIDEPKVEIDTCEELYACEFCDYSSNNAYYLKKHMKVHTGSRPYSCTICHLSFARTCHLKQHMRTHTGEKPYTCEICFSRFSQTSSLNRHLTIHTGEKPHSCDVCGNVYRQKSQLVRHVRTHVSEQYYSCDVCGYICSHLPSLTNHMRIHTAPS